MPRVKKFGNHAFSYLLSLICMTRIYDGQSGFRAMTSEIVRDGLLPSFKFSYTQEMIIRTVKGGYRLHYVDIPFYPRDHGESRLFSNPLNFAIRGSLDNRATTIRCHPSPSYGPGPILDICLCDVIDRGIRIRHGIIPGAIAFNGRNMVVSGNPW